MAVNTINTLQNTLDFISPYIGYKPLSLTDDNQPFITMCNIIAQVVLAPPFTWNFNKNVANFILTSGTQDYRYSDEWSAGTDINFGDIIIDSNGNGQQATTTGLTGTTQPTWSTTLFDSTTDNTVTWQNIGELGQCPDLSDLAYIQYASLQDTVSLKFYQLEIKNELSRDTISQRPGYVSSEYNNNDGSISLRFLGNPNAAYPVSITYQKRLPNFTKLTDTWNPIPDYMSYIYNFGVLSLAALVSFNNNLFGIANSKFVSGLLSYAGGLSETQKNIFLNNWNSTTDAALQAMGQKARTV